MKKRVPRKYLCEIRGVERMPDGKERCILGTVAGDEEYALRTGTMASRQWNMCAICKEHMIRPSFDHQAGRCAGKRDDRIVVEGNWQNAALCFGCNSAKGSRRYAWVHGMGWLVPKYIPVKRASLPNKVA